MDREASPSLAGYLVDLHALDRVDLEPLLVEESNLLWGSLHWRHMSLEPGASGIAWVDGNRVSGYLTLAMHEGSALLGRCFASREGPAEAVEAALLGAAIRGAFTLPEVDRFAGELLLLTPGTTEQLLLHWPDQVAIRCLMEIPWRAAPGPPGREPPGSIEPWCTELLPSATLLLVDAYPGMAERAPAWGYRAPTEARLALQSITACDGAGRFDPQASFVLRNDRTKDLMGFVLACRMGLDVGHIAQLAVAPGLQRQGVGRALLVRALDTLKDLGCQTTHLAVHRDNVGAYALYRALGFRECHSFPEFRLERSDARLA